MAAGNGTGRAWRVVGGLHSGGGGNGLAAPLGGNRQSPQEIRRAVIVDNGVGNNVDRL